MGSLKSGGSLDSTSGVTVGRKVNWSDLVFKERKFYECTKFKLNYFIYVVHIELFHLPTLMHIYSTH